MVPWFLEFVPGKIREVKNGFETGFELVRVFFFNFGTGFETGIELVRIVFWGLG